MRWWLVAALTQWVAYGALLVTPLCALLLVWTILTRHGLRSAVHAASGGILWLLSFAAHYTLSLRFADRSPHLRTYWSVELPPGGSGLGATIRWIVGRLDTLADNPGGTELAVVLWLCAFGGFIFSRRHLAGVLFASVPVAAFGLAAIRQVPLADRLALWIVPALYLGVAMFFDTGARQIRAGWRQKRLSTMAIGVIPHAASLYVSVGIAVQGYAHLDTGVPGDSNHALDDRRAVAWLMARREPGDAILSTRLGWPAIWWYGPVSLRRPLPGGRLPDGSVMLEAFHEAMQQGCARDLKAALEGRRRVLLYVGFPDTPDGFYELLIREFERFGEVVDSGKVSTIGRTAVIRLRDASELSAEGATDPSATGHGLEGCVGLRVARRW